MGAVLKQLRSFSLGTSRPFCTTQHSTTCIHSCKLLIVGGGAGGCSVAWRFARKLGPREIIVLEPNEYHYYQPLFPLIAAGIKEAHESRRELVSLLPPNSCWLKDRCVELNPARCLVGTSCGAQIQYQYLVLAMGVDYAYDDVPGLKRALHEPKSGVSTVQTPEYCSKTRNCLQRHRGGHAVFSHPAECSGGAQDIMYLADDYWSKRKTRSSTSISYMTGAPTMFSVPKYAQALSRVAAERGVVTNFGTELVEVKPGEAVFKTGDKLVTVPYTFLHVTPPARAPEPLRGSALVDPRGFLSVDPHTLQHTSFPNIYGLGDCLGTPHNSVASVGPQSQVVEANLSATMAGKQPNTKYDGYGACPVATSYCRGVLPEFRRDIPSETFPFDQSRECRFLYHINTKYLPYLYWNKIITGKYDGVKKIKKIINPTGRN